MIFPKTSEDVISEIHIASAMQKNHGDLRARQLLHILKKVADDILVEAVIQVFEQDERGESSFLDQEIAGQIVEQVKPFTIIPPESILERCLANWNKSIEQLSFWLVENYGIENIKIALATVENKDILEIEREKLAVMRWWIRDVK